MRTFLLLIVLLVHSTIPGDAHLGVNGVVRSAIGVGVGVGLGFGIGGVGGASDEGGVKKPEPTASMKRAFTALQAWKSAICEDPFGVLATWVGPDVCSYKGVFCAVPDEAVPAPAGLVVAGIDLNHANLSGTLVKELSLLTDMTLLHLNSNRFTGTVPNAFRNLISLEELDLSNNLLCGPFPAVTLNIPNLIYLDLRFNAFSGPIPGDLFDRKLDAIFINNNQFEGEIPQNFGNSPASVMSFANNKLSGSIPSNLGLSGSNLKEILFLNNQLTGCIPERIGLLSEIQVFDASFNSIAGELPDTLSCLKEIEVLDLAHNKLSGLLPDAVCSLGKLTNFSVSFNFFSGFDQACSKRFSGGTGIFDSSLNCFPGIGLQRPKPECSVIPKELSCVRVPSAMKPFVCAAMGQRTALHTSYYP